MPWHFFSKPQHHLKEIWGCQSFMGWNMCW